MIIKIFNPVRIWRASVFTFTQLVKNRELLAEQIRRELFEQHAGHLIGGIWIILHPIFLMSVYLFVFGFVFKSKLGGTFEMPLDYTTYLLSGLIPWLTIHYSLSKSCSVLIENKSLIQQIVFPIEILPARAVLSQSIPFIIMIFVLLVYVAITTSAIPVSYLFIPLLAILLVPWVLGLGLLLSAATVFIRDVREVVNMFNTAGIFILPIIYLPNWIPAVFKPIIYINPFSYIIFCFRDVLYFSRIEHPFAWVIMIIAGLIVFALGSRAFQAVRPYMGDAL